jgi:hypothetical protein
MEMGEGARLWNVRTVHQKHRVIVLDLIEKCPRTGSFSVQPDGAVRCRVGTCVATP